MSRCSWKILFLAALALPAAAAPALALSVLGSPAADLDPGETRFHPYHSKVPPALDKFNVVAPPVPSEWQFQAALTSPFYGSVASPGAEVTGVLYSEVYKHQTEGHTLFLYKIWNSGKAGGYPDESIKRANVAGFAQGWEWLDVGILADRKTFVAGDPVALGLFSPTEGPQFAIIFDLNGLVTELLDPNETTPWVYAVTDAPSWRIGAATVEDSGISVSPIPVLVPVPEPVTTAGMVLGLGCLAGYVRKRGRRR